MLRQAQLFCLCQNEWLVEESADVAASHPVFSMPEPSETVVYCSNLLDHISRDRGLNWSFCLFWKELSLPWKKLHSHTVLGPQWVFQVAQVSTSASFGPGITVPPCLCCLLPAFRGISEGSLMGTVHRAAKSRDCLGCLFWGSSIAVYCRPSQKPSQPAGHTDLCSLSARIQSFLGMQSVVP